MISPAETAQIDDPLDRRFARCLSELGVVLLVGGNFKMETRTLASTITLEVRKGEFAKGLACGIILLVLAVSAAMLAHRLSREAKR